MAEIISLLSQEPYGRFYDVTPSGNPQPIIRFAAEYMGVPILSWGDRQILPDTLETKIENDPDIKKALVNYPSTVTDRNPSDDDPSYNMKRVSSTRSFLNFHLNLGSRLIVADGYPSPTSTHRYSDLVKDFEKLFQIVNGTYFGRDALHFDRKSGGPVTFMIGEASEYTLIDDLFETFNIGDGFCSTADTVILYGYKKQRGTALDRVLRVAKNRYMPVELKDFQVIEDKNNKRLDILD